MAKPDDFDRNVGEWLAQLADPWNRLRYTLYQLHLSRHLPQRQLSILDAGGGSGSDAIPLALRGHTVTIVDFSQVMLDEAQQAARATGVAERLEVVQASVLDLPELYPQPAFDVVICHNVLQYIDDIETGIRAISVPLKQEGVLSLINVNRHSDTLQAALLRLDLDEALAALQGDKKQSEIFGSIMHRLAAEDLTGLLEAAGFALLAHYGVRCVNDYIHDNALKSDPAFYARLEELEIALSDMYPYKHIARFFQLIARKI